MRKICVVFLMMLLCVALGVAQESGKTGKAEKKAESKTMAKAGSVEDHILQLEKEWAQAAIKKDVAAIERIEADDMVTTDPSGRVTTKTQDLEDLKSGDLKFETLDLSNMKVRVYGNTAVVNGEANVKGTYKGQDISGTERFTDVFVKRGGKWQVVSSQITKISQ